MTMHNDSRDHHSDSAGALISPYRFREVRRAYNFARGDSSVEKQVQQTLFDMLYALAARNGRDHMLVGNKNPDVSRTYEECF